MSAPIRYIGMWSMTPAVTTAVPTHRASALRRSPLSFASRVSTLVPCQCGYRYHSPQTPAKAGPLPARKRETQVSRSRAGTARQVFFHRRDPDRKRPGTRQTSRCQTASLRPRIHAPQDGRRQDLSRFHVRDASASLSASSLRSQSGDAKEDKTALKPVNKNSPTLGLVKEFIRSDEFFWRRFNLLGCGVYALRR